MLDPADCGPAFLALCQDTQEIAYDYPEAFFEPTVWTIPRPRPDRDRLAEAVELLKTAKKPLIISGGGVRYSLAEETRGAVRRSTAASRSPRPSPARARSPTTIRRMSARSASSARPRPTRWPAEADVVLAIGTRLMDFTTGSWTRLQPRREVRRDQRRPLGRHQAPRARGGRRRARDGGGTRRRPRRLEGAGRLDRPNARALIAEWNAHRSTTTRSRPTPRCRPTRRWSPPCNAGAEPTRPDHHRRRRPARRAGEGLAGQGAEHLRLRVRLSPAWATRSPPAGATPWRGRARTPIVMVGDGTYLMMNSDIYSSVLSGHKMILIVCDNGGYARHQPPAERQGRARLQQPDPRLQGGRAVRRSTSSSTPSRWARWPAAAKASPTSSEAMDWAQDHRPHHRSSPSTPTPSPGCPATPTGTSACRRSPSARACARPTRRRSRSAPSQRVGV